MRKGLMGHVKPSKRRGGKNEPRNDAVGDDFFVNMGRDSSTRFNPKLANKMRKK